MNIVYKFTSKVSNKFYIGSKTECKVIDNNIVDRNGRIYYTSSLSVELAEEFKDGNMVLEILEDSIPRENLLRREDYYQRLFDVKNNPLSYNKAYALDFHNKDRKILKLQDEIGNIFGETVKEITTRNRTLGRRDTKAQALGYDNFGELYKWVLEKKEEGLSFKAIDRLLGTDHFAGRTVSVHHGHNPLFVTKLVDFERKDINLTLVKDLLLKGKTLIQICIDEGYPLVVVRYLLGGKDFKNLIPIEDKIAINSGFIDRDSMNNHVMREFLKGKSYSDICSGIENLTMPTCQRIIHKLVRERLNVSDFE